MSSKLDSNEIREQTLLYELYLDAKFACKVTLCVLFIIGLIGAVYVGTTPWGQEMIEKLKDFLIQPLRVQDILLYMVLVPVGMCAIGFTAPFILKRIDIFLAKPVILHDLNEIIPWNDSLSGNESATEITTDPYSNSEQCDQSTESDTELSSS